jgi:hypothetical protein
LFSFEDAIEELNASTTQLSIVMRLYNNVGDRVSELLDSSDVFDEDFVPYDIVGRAVDLVLEDFTSDKDFSKVIDLVNFKSDELNAVLRYGYGSSEEIIADYKEVMSG